MRARHLMLLRPLFLAPLVAMGATLAAPAQAAPVTTIEQIEFDGVTVFQASEIEAATEIAPGDRLEHSRVRRTAENIQSLYRTRGYEEVSIQSRLIQKKNEEGEREDTLQFTVKEGKPTRVLVVKLVPQFPAALRQGSEAEKMTALWRKLEPRLLASVGVGPGEVLDQERIGSGKRAMQEILASEEFVGAKIDDVRVIDAPFPADGSPLAARDAARWIQLDIRVDLGDRVTFGFRGNSALPTSRLSTLVDEQRVLGFGKDYIGEIRLKIEEEYRSSGYARVQVTPLTFEDPKTQERHVTYQIDEGPRVRVESLSFDGNVVFSNEALRQQFNQRSASIVQHGYFVQAEVQRAAEGVVSWMRSKGYLSAKLVTINSSYQFKTKAGRKETTANITVYVYEGDQTVVQTVTFANAGAATDNVAPALSPEELKRILGVQESAPLNLFAFNEGLEAVKTAYRNLGYLDIQIVNEASEKVVTYSRENRVADIHLEINQGPQFRLSRIQVDGLTQTREHVVRRELTIQPGDVLDQRKLQDSEARVRRLGVFSGSSFRLVDDPEKPNHKILRISVQEGTPGLVGGGVGFRNDLGLRVFGQTAYTNVGGRNQALVFNAAVNHRPYGNETIVIDGQEIKRPRYRLTEGQAQLAYIWPWFAGDQLTFRPAISLGQNQYRNFDAKNLSFTAAFERRLLDSPYLTALLTYGFEHIEQIHVVNAANSNIDEQHINIGSLTPGLRLDMRDNPLAPTKGLFATTSYEFASPYLGSQAFPYRIGYSSYRLRTDYMTPLATDVTWTVSFRTGYQRQNEPVSSDPDLAAQSGTIPLIKQFTLGGIGSLRGYEEQELNRQSQAIRGSLSFVNYRTQLDLPFAGPLRFGLFLDAANLLVDEYSLNKDMRYGTGFGFHYMTPVGPVSLDWGFSVGPYRAIEPYHFYFSIGVI